eukprot:TRINITY_DN3166_c0_g1_i2.p2 TRINITY_DN3166_c0_g1~~TRINITY_DN3166_c0_g1_i2.p2  ORF type:complete len:106 (+),score=18.10 TRINITY_DN3166_c0_g1_i2:323-640(+)
MASKRSASCTIKSSIGFGVATAPSVRLFLKEIPKMMSDNFFNRTSSLHPFVRKKFNKRSMASCSVSPSLRYFLSATSCNKAASSINSKSSSAPRSCSSLAIDCSL